MTTHPDPLSAACAELVEATATLVEACSELVKLLSTPRVAYPYWTDPLDRDLPLKP